MKPSRSEGGMGENMGREAWGNGRCTNAEGGGSKSIASLLGEGEDETCCVPTNTCTAKCTPREKIWESDAEV